MNKRKLVFISNMAAPYQVKLCYELQIFYDAEFWFYVHLESNRPKWWAIPLGDKCKILEGSFYLPGLNYNNLQIKKYLTAFDPDIILLGGFFFPTHYWIKNWCHKRNKVVIVLSERITFFNLTKFEQRIKLIYKKLLLSFFKDIDLLFALGDYAKEQYVSVFGFDTRKVVVTQYPQDIDENLDHPLRESNNLNTFLFPNKLTLKYNPIFALAVFKRIHSLYPHFTLRMNADGELRSECEKYIKANQLEGSVVFLDEIKAWSDLPLIYRNADIALFTAYDSNGPNTLIECMASGTGIIMSKQIHNTKEYTINERNCFICDLLEDEFFEAVMKYLNTDGLITEHGALGKRLVSGRSVKETAKLYHQILEEHFSTKRFSH